MKIIDDSVTVPFLCPLLIRLAFSLPLSLDAKPKEWPMYRRIRGIQERGKRQFSALLRNRFRWPMIGVGFNSHEILTSCSGMTMDDRPG